MEEDVLSIGPPPTHRRDDERSPSNQHGDGEALLFISLSLVFTWLFCYNNMIKLKHIGVSGCTRVLSSLLGVMFEENGIR